MPKVDYSKRYLLFAMPKYEPSGGMDDFLFSFNSMEKALKKLEKPKYKHVSEVNRHKSWSFNMLDKKENEVLQFPTYDKLCNYLTVMSDNEQETKRIYDSEVL